MSASSSGLLEPGQDLDYTFIAGGYGFASVLCVVFYFAHSLGDVEALKDVWLVVSESCVRIRWLAPSNLMHASLCSFCRSSLA